MSPITQDELSRAQQDALAIVKRFATPVLPVLPEGSIEKEFIMEKLQCSDRTADKVLRRAVNAGELETGIFRKKRYWWPKKRGEVASSPKGAEAPTGL